jgi:uncharacterized protein
MPRTQTPFNPFVFSRALAPSEAILRRREVDDLLAKVLGGHNVALYGPRRTGKTSLLHQLCDVGSKQRLHVVQVDLSDVLSAADVTIRLEQAFRALPGGARRIVGRELGTLGITTPLGGVTAGRRDRGLEPLATVHALLNLPSRLAHDTKKRVLIVLDEFQALIDLEGMAGVFRSHLQHDQNVACVFCGSEPTLLRKLFEDRARPFYGQALPVPIPGLDFRAAHDFVVSRFRESGKDCGEVVPTLLELSDLHPQRLMLLAYMLWEQTRRYPATMTELRLAHDAAMRAADQELRILWDGLSVNERRVLVAISSGLTPYQAEARALAGIRNPSSAQKPTDALLKRSILIKDERERFAIVDPLLARWVRRNGGARGSIFIVPDPGGGFSVTDGPSRAFMRSQHDTLEAAERAADRIAAELGMAADVMIYDSDDPNDLPEWALRER